MRSGWQHGGKNMIKCWFISYAWRHEGGHWQFASDVIDYHFTDWCLKYNVDAQNERKKSDEYVLLNALEITRTQFQKLAGRLQ